jgi:hypothetical protein
LPAPAESDFLRRDGDAHQTAAYSVAGTLFA